MRIFIVDQPGPLLDYLFRAMKDTKKTRVREALKSKVVSVNGKSTTRFDFALAAGDQVRIETGKKVLTRPGPAFGVEIVFEDDAIVVVNKPSGLLTIATEKIKNRNAFRAVNEFLNESGHRRKNIFLVHRLDRDASGLLIFAKNAAIKEKLQGHWEKVKKTYYAVVEGRPKKESGTVASHLSENKFLRVFSGPRTQESKLSVTHYRTVRTSGKYSFMEIDLETGRKHQIRVHMADLGCPIAGDENYGAKTDPAGRLTLHAARLEFAHPVTGDKMKFESRHPEEFEKII